MLEQETPLPIPKGTTRSSRPVSALLLIWWLLFLGVIPFPFETPGSSDFITATSEGSLDRVVLALSLATIGAAFAPEALAKLRSRTAATMLKLLGAYVLWSGASVLWSQAPGLTFRRLVLLGLILLAGVGLGAGFYGARRDGPLLLARHAVVAGMIAAANVWVPKLATGDVNILSPTWTLAPISIGFTTGIPILFGTLAAVHLHYSRENVIPGVKHGSMLTVSVFLFTIFNLRKRGVMAATAFTTAALTLINRGRAARGRNFFLVVVAGSGLAILLLAMGSDIISSIVPLIARGETAAEIGELSGRTRLWPELLSHYFDRPLHGYGFGAFWTVDETLAIWRAVRWPAVNAHNGYLDELLATGVIGFTLMAAILGNGLRVALKAAREKREGICFMVAAWMSAFLLLNLTDSFLQSFFHYAFIATMVGVFFVIARFGFDEERPRIYGRRGSLSPRRRPG